MSHARRKSSVSSGKKIAPHEQDGTLLKGGTYARDFDEDDQDTPIVTATLVKGSLPSESSLKQSVQRSASNRRPSNATSRQMSNALLEPPSDDVLPPPLNPWPDSLRNKICQKISRKPDTQKGKIFLTQHRWPEGLQEELFRSCKKIPLRFYIVDDSGSMISDDGRRIYSQGPITKMIKCTRWAELSESIMFLGELSESVQVISEFRLINGADPIIVGLDDDDSLKFLREVMRESPAGPTPLCAHIAAVVTNIESIAPLLREHGQRAVVVIATDGESTDGDVAQALRPLINLPVNVIVRLCTEEKEIIDYWNNIDQQLELDIDVLDDQLGDAKQVQEVNGWLTYGEPLHRIREFGASMKELDIIDEKTITMDQMRVMCAYLFCQGQVEALPHPAISWTQFTSALKELIRHHDKVFCPITQTMRPWVDVSALYKTFAKEIKSNQTDAGMSCVVG